MYPNKDTLGTLDKTVDMVGTDKGHTVAPLDPADHRESVLALVQVLEQAPELELVLVELGLVLA